MDNLDKRSLSKTSSSSFEAIPESIGENLGLFNNQETPSNNEAPTESLDRLNESQASYDDVLPTDGTVIRKSEYTNSLENQNHRVIQKNVQLIQCLIQYKDQETTFEAEIDELRCHKAQLTQMNAGLQANCTNLQSRLDRTETKINQLIPVVTTTPTRINIIRAFAVGTVLVGAGAGATLLTFKFLETKSPTVPQKLLEIIKTPEGILGVFLPVFGIIGMIILAIVAHSMSKDYKKTLYLTDIREPVGNAEDLPRTPQG